MVTSIRRRLSLRRPSLSNWKGVFMRDSIVDLKWYYLLAIVVGIMALVAVVVYLVKTYDLLARLPFSNTPQEIEE